MAHRRARLTVFGRQLLVARVEAGWREAHVVEQLGISRATAYTWVRRHRTDRPAGLEDRSSRPRHSPRRLAALQAASTQPTPGAPWVDQKHPSSEPYRLVPRGWLSASDWPGGTQVDALVGRLLGMRARRSTYSGGASPCTWSGPLVLDATEDGLTGSEILRKSGYWPCRHEEAMVDLSGSRVSRLPARSIDGRRATAPGRRHRRRLRRSPLRSCRVAGWPICGPSRRPTGSRSSGAGS